MSESNSHDTTHTNNEHDNAPSNNNDNASKEPLKALKTIWDDDMVKKISASAKGQQRWKCFWCQAEFIPWNATKALLHVSGIASKNIRSCPQYHKIDDEHKKRYNVLLRQNQKKRNAQSATAEEMNDSISHHNISVAQKLDRSAKKSRKVSASGSAPGGNLIDLFNKQQPSITETQSLSSRGSIGGLQLKLGQKIAPHDASAESQLTMAIADLIHSHALPFSLADDPKFKKMLALARNVPFQYNPPGRNRVAGALLDLNYESYVEKNMRQLMSEADVFGVSFFGDGATVKKMPLFNILASGINNLSTCLEIVDCTGHLEAGGKKDAEFISNQFLKHIERFENELPNSVDLILFDGALNVQKAGLVLAVSYQRLTVLHGAEHVVSLFFNDVFKNDELRWFVNFTRLTYRTFGSGAMHKPYAIFHKFSREHNNGRKIGLIRASDTRMGGHVIALMRLYRLKDALLSTVTSVEFKDVKVSFPGVMTVNMFLITHIFGFTIFVQIGKTLINLILDTKVWESMKIVIRSLFPAIILLRLADSNRPNMDKLYFYVRRMDLCLQKSKELLDQWYNEVKQKSLESVEEEVTESDIDLDSRDNNRTDNDENDVDTMDDSDGATDSQSEVSLGDRFIKSWNHRRTKLVHDFSIAGWMVSPIPDVFMDAKMNQTFADKRRVEDLLIKLLSHEAEKHGDDTSKMLDTFWTEHNDFHGKKNVYGGTREYVWNSQDIRNGESFLWHQKYSLIATKYLGLFACRVTSKILGIGSAERNWGDVKHIKDGKRSHLSGDQIKKLATIYGSDCAERAKIKREAMKKGEDNDDDCKVIFWDDADFDRELDFDSTEHLISSKTKKPIRVVKCWMEPWELEDVGKNDPVSKARLLKKYGGLEWYDIDSNKMFFSDKHQLVWGGRRRCDVGGWMVKAYSEDWRDDDPHNHKHEESFVICNDSALHDSLADYYHKSKGRSILAITQKDDDEGENESIS